MPGHASEGEEGEEWVMPKSKRQFKTRTLTLGPAFLGVVTKESIPKLFPLLANKKYDGWVVYEFELRGQRLIITYEKP